MILLLALQFTVPLLLVTWIGLAPARSALGFWVQVVSVAASLVAIGLIGLWAFPPWWTPYAIGCLLLIAILVALRRRRSFASVLPSSIAGWSIVVLFLTLGGLAGIQATLALAGRAMPQGRVVNLAFPLESGAYLVVNGGSDFSINAHMKTLNAADPRFRAARGQSYGVDIVKIDGIGLRAKGLRPAEPRAYHIYGVNVLAPCAGEIVSVVDGLPDMQVPQTDRANLAGNHVRLRCADAEILLAHLRPGSLQVTVAAQVDVGDLIGTVGNSGNSDEPHLHIHAQTSGPADQLLSGDPLPMRFNGRFLVRNDRVAVP